MSRGPEPTFGTAIYRRFTMIGGDFETVRGAWGFRGEVAEFVDRSIEGGAGVDRKAGGYRMTGSVLVTRNLEQDRTTASILALADRSFVRETRNMIMNSPIAPVQHLLPS